jgi:enoyl-CoA hydratase
VSEAAVLRRDEGAVAILTLNRPAVLNAIDTAAMRLLGEHVQRLATDGAVNVVVITGAGERAFSAGGDIREMSTFAGLACDVAMQAWQDTLGLIMRAPKPFIAAINGDAFGGGTELAMACHIRVSADHARLGQPEITLDHIPGGGGTQRLPRLIPLGLAYEYLLTGEPIPAEEAYRIGLVNHVWPARELMTRALELATRIARRSPV